MLKQAIVAIVIGLMAQSAIAGDSIYDSDLESRVQELERQVDQQKMQRIYDEGMRGIDDLQREREIYNSDTLAPRRR